MPEGSGYSAPGPWGFWSTLAFSGVIAAVFVGLSLALTVPFAAVEVTKNSAMDIEAHVSSLESNGLYLSIVTLVTSAVCSGLILLFAGLRRGISIADYLQLKRVPMTLLGRWILAVGLVALLWDLSNWLLGRDIVPPFMLRAYLTAGIMPLFWLAIVVGAPLFEELFFRGFVFAGLCRSFLGSKGTVILTAVGWAAIHQQYEIYDIVMISVVGVILGMARLKTKSVQTPIVMHAMLNLIATLEVWFLMRLGDWTTPPPSGF